MPLPIPLRSWLSSKILLSLLVSIAVAQATNTSALLIYNSSTTYHYVGCWNETTGIAQSTGARALPDLFLILPGNMTVEICLDFCAHNHSTPYKYAGLEYSRECWCANRLSALSTLQDNAICNTECDGNKAEACGGSLKLSLYNLTTTDNGNGAGAMTRGSVAAMKLLMGSVLVAVVAGALL
jgi:hypothetical protein